MKFDRWEGLCYDHVLQCVQWEPEFIVMPLGA